MEDQAKRGSFKLCKDPDLVRDVIGHSLRWTGHIHRKKENINSYEHTKNVPEGRIPTTRPKSQVCEGDCLN